MLFGCITCCNLEFSPFSGLAWVPQLCTLHFQLRLTLHLVVLRWLMQLFSLFIYLNTWNVDMNDLMRLKIGFGLIDNCIMISWIIDMDYKFGLKLVWVFGLYMDSYWITKVDHGLTIRPNKKNGFFNIKKRWMGLSSIIDKHGPLVRNSLNSIEISKINLK